MKKFLTIISLTCLMTIAWAVARTVLAQEKPAEGTNLSKTGAAPELWRQVEIIRTAHGVPHIRAENLRAAGYALAWLQSEDYGSRTALNVLEARGQLAQLDGSSEAIEGLGTSRRVSACRAYWASRGPRPNDVGGRP